MEDVYDLLAERCLALQRSARDPGPAGRVLIGIAGAPGSGKTTASLRVRDAINRLAGTEVAALFPMDGFHYYKKHLKGMPDPDMAFARRGALWTFDGPAFVSRVESLRAKPEVLVPSFDHAVGDPIEDDLRVGPEHRIVLVEGNYVLCDVEPWARLRDLFDESWMITCGVDEAMERVFKRQTAIGLKPEESRLRIASNDRPNAELITNYAHRASLRVPSLPFREPQV
jgi:pantothenate kinase